MSDQHTPGPWRWEFNRKHRNVSLVGGKPRFDLTIMGFGRWGMFGAVPLLRDLAHDGMNIMHRLCDRLDWIAPFLGRAHHADWCARVTHPDMVLMAAAPDLLEACRAQHQALDGLMALCVGHVPGFMPTQSAAWPAIVAGHAAIQRSTGAAS